MSKRAPSREHDGRAPAGKCKRIQVPAPAPPSLLSAVVSSADLVSLIVGHLGRRDLPRAALVCRDWSASVSSRLGDAVDGRIAVAATPEWMFDNSDGEEEAPTVEGSGLWLYSTKTREWRAAAMPPVEIRDHKSIQLARGDGFIYAVVPCTLFQDRQTMAARYDMIDDTWSVLATPNRECRQEFGLAFLGEKLYAIGGKYGFDNVEAYSPELKRWEPCSTMLEVHSMCDATALGGWVYVTCGYDLAGATSTVERWRPGLTSWERVRGLGIARWSHHVVTVEEKLFVLGGQTMSIHEKPFAPERRCEMFCPVKNEWAVVTVMPTLRQGFAVSVVDHLVYVVGGKEHSGEDSYWDGRPSSLVEIYDTRSGLWRQEEGSVPFEGESHTGA